MANLRIIIRGIMALLGFFEFFIAYELLTTDSGKLASLRMKHILYPANFINQVPTRYLLCAWVIFLGLLRLSWATSNGGVGPWLCLVATHVTECVFLWTLALTSTHFNPKQLDLFGLVQKVLAFDIGTKESCVVLCIVPVLVGLAVLHGPTAFAGLFGKKKTA